jgi:hypothetical protein
MIKAAEIVRYQTTITFDPDDPRASVQAACDDARAALGPTARPITIYQASHVLGLLTVVFSIGSDVPVLGEIEAQLIERIAPEPHPLTRGPLALSASGGGAATDWIRLASGGAFFPLRPEPASITLYDIASGLARECRYNGQLERLEFYSVAEHCVHLSRAVPPELARWALLHDASEALGLRDLPRPVKPAIGAAYRDAESAVMWAVALRFGLSWPMPAALKSYDDRILQNERAAIWAEPQVWASDAAGPPLPGTTIQGWLPYEARTRFLRRADELGIREVTL